MYADAVLARERGAKMGMSSDQSVLSLGAKVRIQDSNSASSDSSHSSRGGVIVVEGECMCKAGDDAIELWCFAFLFLSDKFKSKLTTDHPHQLNNSNVFTSQGDGNLPIEV